MCVRACACVCALKIRVSRYPQKSSSFSGSSSIPPSLTSSRGPSLPPSLIASLPPSKSTRRLPAERPKKVRVEPVKRSQASAKYVPRKQSAALAVAAGSKMRFSDPPLAPLGRPTKLRRQLLLSAPMPCRWQVVRNKCTVSVSRQVLTTPYKHTKKQCVHCA